MPETNLRTGKGSPWPENVKPPSHLLESREVDSEAPVAQRHPAFDRRALGDDRSAADHEQPRRLQAQRLEPVLGLQHHQIGVAAHRQAVAKARAAATSNLSIVLEGETGTGKERFAEAIHGWSGRSGRFLGVNCAVYSKAVAAAELFGYCKGAFTGAEQASAGHNRAAQRGTLLLDELIELPLDVQAMLLRATELRPQDGNIADSLGWVLFRLGDKAGAVEWLEKAIELEPRNSVINDHLGDAYWAVGRQRQGRFQWRRALALDPEPGEAPKIETKLRDGLPGYPTNSAQR